MKDEGLVSNCTNVKNANYTRYTDERRYVLGSILKITCGNCKFLNLVYTGKQHRVAEKSEKGLKYGILIPKAPFRVRKKHITKS